MTTLVDREHALEAHYAHLELTAFKARSLRYRDFGTRLAAHLGLRGADAEQFAAALARRSVIEPDDERLARHLSAELSGRGRAVSVAEIRRMSLAEDDIGQDRRTMLPTRQPWVEFVIAQFLFLFGLQRLGADRSAPAMRTAADPRTTALRFPR